MTDEPTPVEPNPAVVAIAAIIAAVAARPRPTRRGR